MAASPLPDPTRRFALAPPLPPRPLEARRALRLLRELLRSPAETEKAFELFDALGGRGDEPIVQALAAHREGRRLFQDKPALLPHLADREGLSRLPDGSLGRAYLAFAQRNGFAADGLLDANAAGLGALNERLDPDRRWFFERVNLVHDLWHVLTGYGTDAAGEAALLAFSHAQGLRSRMIRLLLLAAMARGPMRGGFAFQRFLLAALRRGRRARLLLVQRYEDLLAQPLEEVQRALRIAPLAEAHPSGIFRASEDFRCFERVTA
jgi:ubiquinone biosynthesis protein COQ4